MSLKQPVLLVAAALAAAGLVLASRQADGDVASAHTEPVVPQAVAVRRSPSRATVIPATADAQPGELACSDTHLLAEWQLLSAGAGGYREAGFAVLHSPRRGTVSVAEGAALGQGVTLQRVLADGVQLRCGAIVLDLALPLANGAAPPMRSALPDPERSASN